MVFYKFNFVLLFIVVVNNASSFFKASACTAGFVHTRAITFWTTPAWPATSPSSTSSSAATKASSAASLSSTESRVSLGGQGWVWDVKGESEMSRVNLGGQGWVVLHNYPQLLRSALLNIFENWRYQKGATPYSLAELCRSVVQNRIHTTTTAAALDTFLAPDSKFGKVLFLKTRLCLSYP